MPENEKEKALDKLPQAKFVAIPSKDGPLYFQVYVLCGGVWTKEPVEPSTRYSFRANDKVVLGLIGSNREAFYYKSNTDYPPHNKCIGIQLVITSVNVNSRELNEQEKAKYDLALERSKILLPPFTGIRAKFIMDNKSSNEDGISQTRADKKKIESLTPFTAPLYLYKKTGEIVNSYRNPTGKFDYKDLSQRSKVWFVNHMELHSQNLATFQPLELTKQTLTFLLKTIQDFVNKKE